MAYRLEVVADLIEQWGKERGIIQHGVPMGQAIKTLEETTELLSALSVGDELEVKDAAGDIFVTLLMVCGTSNIDFTECVNGSYDEIKDRKGYLRADGIFVKEEV